MKLSLLDPSGRLGGSRGVFDAFGVQLSRADLNQVGAIAEAAYPREACGLGFGGRDASVQQWVSITNRSARPKVHFELDAMEHMAAVDAAGRKGWGARVLFHSHCDCAPNLSDADIAGAVWQGVELIPAVIYLIVSVRGGRRRQWAVHRYLPDSAGFESRVGPEAL